MLVDILSDLHVEFNGNLYQRILKESTSKKIIIAGDMGPVAERCPATRQAFVWLCNKYEEVIYVPGNHDYYGGTIDQGEIILSELEDLLPNLTLLSYGKKTMIGNTKVIGATLWVPYDINMMKRDYLINDPFQILGLEKVIGGINKGDSEFLRANANENTIIVTHHLPHPSLIAPLYRNELTNVWFMSDETTTFEECNPKMWIFGHSHVRSNSMIGNTLCINNAVGYPREYKPIERLTYDI